MLPMANAADYYWVGGSGDWSDLSHWSTTSGGPPNHTALPTSIDDVFFNGASFTSPTDIVTVQSDATFRDLRISVGQDITFSGPENVTMNCHGLLLIDNVLRYDFDGTLRMVGNGSAQTISAMSITIAKHVIFDNPDGTWIAGPFNADSLVQFVSGNLVVVDDIETKFIEFSATSPSRLTLQQDIFLSGSDFMHNGAMIPVALVDLTNINYALASKGFIHFFGLESTFQILSAGQEMSLDGVIFANPRGSALIEVIGAGSLRSRLTHVAPTGEFIGNINTDALELGFGVTYTWESGQTFDIGSISLTGSISCMQLTNFRSSIDGQEAFFRLTSMSLIDVGELIGVKDIHVQNGTISLLNSFDQGNIVGWIIEEQELFEEERLPLCPGQQIYLKPDDPEEGWTYAWNDLSTLDSIEVSESGTYSLEVSDPEGCMTSDTVEVFLFDPGSFSIGNDTIICEGDMIEVNAEIMADSYTWSNGDMDATTILPTGLHFVEVLLNGCEVRDTIIIDAKPLPIVDLGPDQMKCIGESLELTLSLSDVEYVWSDNSTASSFTANEEGTYWVDVDLDGCIARDSIMFNFIELPIISLGRDSVLCEGDAIEYDFSNADLSFTWNDNVSDSRRTIDTAGEYWLEASNGQCTIRDSVVIGVSPRATFDIGRDTMLCVGEAITLEANPTSDETIMWIDGSTNLTFDVTRSGTYWLDVNKMGCIVRDEIVVIYNDPPTFDFGSDTLICEQLPLVLQPGVRDASYRWQDGSSSDRFTIDSPGRYSVEVSKDGCTTTDEIDIDTKVCAFYRIYLPEVFSPNADGVNDEFRPEFPNDIQILSFEMTIYDRWGGQLYQSRDRHIGWDGTFSQKPLNSGTFVYSITLDYIDDRGAGSMMHRGEFAILR